MAMGNNGTFKPSQCSSCSRNDSEVTEFTTGPGYSLCEECVEICRLIVAQIKADYESLEGKTAKARFA